MNTRSIWQKLHRIFTCMFSKATDIYRTPQKRTIKHILPKSDTSTRTHVGLKQCLTNSCKQWVYQSATNNKADFQTDAIQISL